MSVLSKYLLALLLVAIFVAAAVAGGPGNDLELAVMQRAAELRTAWPPLAGAATGLTTLGGTAATLGVASAASLLLLLRRAPARALLIALPVLVERSLADGLKEWTGRPRPSFELDCLPHSLAFPSGHAANSMTALLITALIAAPPHLRRTAAIAAVTLSVVVGLTRVILGVHWPSDVIGGWALGLLFAGATVMIGEHSAALRFEPQHQIVGRHRPPLDENEAA